MAALDGAYERNYDDSMFEHNCSCRAMSDEECAAENDEGYGGGESSKCKVYCRPKACECQSGCTT